MPRSPLIPLVVWLAGCQQSFIVSWTVTAVNPETREQTAIAPGTAACDLYGDVSVATWIQAEPDPEHQGDVRTLGACGLGAGTSLFTERDPYLADGPWRVAAEVTRDGSPATFALAAAGPFTIDTKASAFLDQRALGIGLYIPTEAGTCDDLADNDGDSAVDCNDPDCAGDARCPELCVGGEDEDGDLKVDCADPDCTLACAEDCTNDVDDDADDDVDCRDPECFADPACNTVGAEVCDDGRDNDGDVAIDCQDDDCIGDPACAQTDLEDCTVPGDEEGDGLADCVDDDCFLQPECQDLTTTGVVQLTTPAGSYDDLKLITTSDGLMISGLQNWMIPVPTDVNDPLAWTTARVATGASPNVYVLGARVEPSRDLVWGRSHDKPAVGTSVGATLSVREIDAAYGAVQAVWPVEGGGYHALETISNVGLGDIELIALADDLTPGTRVLIATAQNDQLRAVAPFGEVDGRADGFFLGGGSGTLGTPVPFVARVDGTALTWQTTLPGAAGDVVGVMVRNDDVIAVAQHGARRVVLAGLDGATGAVQWSTAFDFPLTDVVVRGLYQDDLGVGMYGQVRSAGDWRQLVWWWDDTSDVAGVTPVRNLGVDTLVGPSGEAATDVAYTLQDGLSVVGQGYGVAWFSRSRFGLLTDTCNPYAGAVITTAPVVITGGSAGLATSTPFDSLVPTASYTWQDTALTTAAVCVP